MYDNETVLEYKTVAGYGTAELEEKKSKFISNVNLVENEDEAIDFINGIKSKYWDATHNVYAYYIEGDRIIQRFSDDGEPSGTAGLPVLEVIKKMELRNVVVVVTRYFGGTLLGAAGLIRAYGKSAAMGIEAAGVVRKKLCRQINVILEYQYLGKIQNYISNRGYMIKDVKYAQDVEMLVLVPVKEMDRFTDYIREATNGEALVEETGKEYVTESLKLDNGHINDR